jgi:hypothetical protein
VTQKQSDIEKLEGDHLATGPDEDDGRDVESRSRIPVSVFYEMEVYVRGVVLVLDGPWDDVGSGQVGRIVNEGLDDWWFSTHSSEPPKRGSDKDHI